jgi:hypothetical protein
MIEPITYFTYALGGVLLVGFVVVVFWPWADPEEPRHLPTGLTIRVVSRPCDIVGCTEPAHHFFAPLASHRDTLLAVCDGHAESARLWVGKYAELPEEFGGERATTEPVTEGLPDGRSGGV